MVTPAGISLAERCRQCGLDVKSGRSAPWLSLLDGLDLSDLDLMTMADLVQWGPEPDDACLIATLGLMFAALSDGSLCIGLDGDDPAVDLPNPLRQAAGDAVSDFVHRLDAGDYDELIDARGAESFKPLVVDASSGRRLLYFQKFHFHEQRLKRRLEDFLSIPDAPLLPAAEIVRLIDGLYRREATIRREPGGDPINRDAGQVEAIRAALTQPLLVVSGGPGTGKTSLLANMLRALARTGIDPDRIRLAAPTGRAAQRMVEALAANLATIAAPDASDRRLGDIRGSTLHKLLMAGRRQDEYPYSLRHALSADVIVVDEVSMVDVVMMDRLFQSVDARRTRVILLGDKDQLPSVDAGAVLADMRPSGGDTAASHFVALKTVYRSGGRLQELAGKINAGGPIRLQPVDFEAALQVGEGQWAFVNGAGRHRLAGHLDAWSQHHYLRRPAGESGSYAALVDSLNRSARQAGAFDANRWRRRLQELIAMAYRCRVLTLPRSGIHGAAWINARIADHLRITLDPAAPAGKRLFQGALVMVTRNDYTRGLYNGDIGVVLGQNDGSPQVHFPRPDGWVSVPSARLVDWDLAFAMTVHKSQGSEFHDTLLVLPEDPSHRLLTREIMYTAATRSSRRLIIYGKPDAFQGALKRRIVRQSGLILH